MSKYLQVRPHTRTLPPNDPRMSKAQRWVPWTQKKVEGKDKPAKFPIGKTSNPTTWSFYHAARVSLADEKIAGLGFQMLGRPEIVSIDIDNCVDEAGQQNPIAASLLAILEAANGMFHVELTPSGKGLRIFAGETPLPYHDFLNHDSGVEVYSGESGRFLTYTGKLLPGFGTGPFLPLPEAAVRLLGEHATKWKEGLSKDAKVTPAQEPLPELSRREDWEKLHVKALQRVGVDHKEFLKNGSLGRRYASASEQLFAVEQALLKHLKRAQAYQILISADGSWGVALEHRENNETRAREFLWQDLERAQDNKNKYEKEKAVSSNGWKDCDIVVELTDDGARAKIMQINIMNAFALHPDWINRLAYNTFDGRITVDRKDMTSAHIIEMRAWVTQFLRWQMEPPRQDLEEAILTAAKRRPWNPIENELRSVIWDGKHRFKAFTAAVVKDPQELDFQIFRKWLVAFVARGIRPGSQMDTVLCLSESVGGGYKTSFARVMAGSQDRFSDAATFGSDKDAAMLRVGMRVVELGEGAAAQRGDRYALKLDVSKTDDHYRPPWGRTTEKRPRGFVYILTTNDKKFLRNDQDGLRRIWSVSCREVIDIQWVRENREQVLAEAVALYDAGERWWWNREEESVELRARQSGARSESFIDAAVQHAISNSENVERGYTTLLDMKRHVEAVSGSTLNSSAAQFLIDAMLRHGMESGQKRIDGKITRYWRHHTWTENLSRKEEL